jgi:hypothetical protein
MNLSKGEMVHVPLRQRSGTGARDGDVLNSIEHRLILTGSNRTAQLFTNKLKLVRAPA